MPQFNYTAIDPQGRQYNDIVSAETISALESLLQSQGAWLVKARVSKDFHSQKLDVKTKTNVAVKRWELINFYTQLSLLLNAGVTLSSSLNKLADDLFESKLGPVVRNLANNVEAGTPLPLSMSAFPNTFSNQAIALIEAGEASGKLPESFITLAENLEWVDGLIANARQALIYPMAICAAAVGLVILLFTVVVPRFQVIFDQLSAEMPTITVVVLSASEFFASTWMLWAFLAVASPFIITLPKRIEKLGILKDRFMLHIPFLGDLAQSLAISQFSITLEMLIRSGIPLARALELSARQSPNKLIAIAAESARKAVNEGRSMSDELSQHKIFTQTFITMAQTGENSGQLDTTLKKVGDYYNTIVPRKIKAFFSVFEPTIIITLTVVVGTVALALVLPIMSLWNI